MAAPTEDQIQTQWNQIVWMLKAVQDLLNVNTPNMSAEYDEFVGTDLIGDFTPGTVAGLDAFRSSLSALVSVPVARSMLDPILLEYGKQQGFPETDPLDILDRLHVYMAEGSERIKSRTVVYGTPSNDGGNTGDPVLNRLTTGPFSYAIENITAEAKEFKCVRHRYSGTRLHQELFEIRGADKPRDFLAGIVSRDRIGSIRSISADDSLNIVQNPSFNGFDGTSPDITEVTNWTIATIGDVQIEDIENGAGDVYRTSAHEGTAPGALRFQDNEKASQELSVTNPSLVRGVPYYCQIAFKREASCDGNLNLRVGSQSVAVALVAQSGYTILRMTLDEGLFLRGFDATTLDIEIELDSRTTGTLLVDDLVIAPMTLWDGTWWAMVGGAIPSLVEDKITATDTIASDSINQYWIWRIYNKTLPHDTVASTNITWADPT